MAKEDLYGQDILLNTEMQALTTASGEIVISTGIQTVLQDIMLRVFTPLGSLFYDKKFGSLVHEWIKEENTQTNRQGLEAEVKMRIGIDPRVKKGTVISRVLNWNEKEVTLEALFQLIEEDHPFNLVISMQGDGNMEYIIKDVYTG